MPQAPSGGSSPWASTWRSGARLAAGLSTSGSRGSSPQASTWDSGARLAAQPSTSGSRGSSPQTSTWGSGRRLAARASTWRSGGRLAAPASTWGSGGRLAAPGQHWGFAVAASAVLAAYNNVTGLNSGHERWYVRLNAGATGAALAAATMSGLTLADLGLGRGRWLPSRLGYGLAAGAGVGWLVIAAAPATRPLLGDQRATGLSGRDVAYQALIRIPVGTALWEETAFRGVLQAALRRVLPEPAAIAVTNGVFGAWHIRPTLQALQANGLAGDRRRAIAGTCAGCAATAAGGALLSWLRAHSGRLADTVLLHAAVNSGGLIAAHAVAVLGQKDKLAGRPAT